VCVCVLRNQPALLKTTSSLAWSWRRWTGRIPTWFVLPQWERSEVRRFLSCLTAGEAPSTTGALLIPETSSLLAGVPWRNTVCSRPETSVSASFGLFGCMEHAIGWWNSLWYCCFGLFIGFRGWSCDEVIKWNKHRCQRLKEKQQQRLTLVRLVQNRSRKSHFSESPEGKLLVLKLFNEGNTET